jgi:hypothetical protein
VTTLYHKCVITPQQYRVEVGQTSRTVSNRGPDANANMLAAVKDLVRSGPNEFDLVAIFDLPFGIVVECRDSFGR